jgi:uncharacterized protein YegJ (DUF2314 family)
MQARINRIAAMLLILICGCNSNSQPSAQPATNEAGTSERDRIPAGNIRDEDISFQFAIYYLPKPKKEPFAELDSLLKDRFKQFRRIEKLDDHSKGMSLVARLDSDPQKSYAPPDLESLKYFGRGVPRRQAEQLQHTETALIVDFRYSKENVRNGLLAAVELIKELANETGGVIWDETTREVFTPEEWTERRIKSWKDGVPDVTKFITIHAYNTGEFVRAISLGMQKFGLPDIVIDKFSWSLDRNMGHLLNMFAQALEEGAEVDGNSQIDLDLRAIKHPDVRDPQLSTLKEHSTGIALLSLKKGKGEKGDPQNRLIEITFDRGSGPDVHAKQSQILGSLFGWEDSISQIKHDDELDAASQRARSKLPDLRADFKKGLAPGEFIQLKTSFETPDGGHEYMWVEVAKWDGGKITGLLKNEPFHIPNLHGGQTVEVSEADVFDYIRTRADGTSEGNETGRIIKKQEKQRGM